MHLRVAVEQRRRAGRGRGRTRSGRCRRPPARASARSPRWLTPGSDRAVLRRAAGRAARARRAARRRRSAARTPPPCARRARRCRCSPCARPRPGVWTTNSPAVGVVGRGRAERLHVGAVAGLGHREAAGQLEARDVREVRARGGCAVPRCSTAPPNRPNWTPHFTSSERSPNASVSNAAIERPTSPSPPYSTGKPIAVPPASASSRAHVEHLRPVLLARQVDHGRVAGQRQPGPDHVPDLGVRAVEERAERGGLRRHADVSYPGINCRTPIVVCDRSRGSGGSGRCGRSRAACRRSPGAT